MKRSRVQAARIADTMTALSATARNTINAQKAFSPLALQKEREGGAMKTKCALTPPQKRWAYDMWCIGYTQLQIADALNVCEKTVQRALKNKDRIRPILKYSERNETK